MNKTFIWIVLAAVVIIGAAVLYQPNMTSAPVQTPGGPVACTMEAKACPDGSYVGRSGPNCEFAACPKPTTSVPPKPAPGATGNVTLGVSQNSNIGALNIRLNSIVSDSRCAQGVTCVWAGTVTANVTLSNASYTTTTDLSLNTAAYNFYGQNVTLASVTPPAKVGTQLLPGDYRLTFHSEPR